MKAFYLIASVFLFVLISPAQEKENLVSSYSIVARDSLTGDLGIAVKSNIPAIGAIVPYARTGIGVIAAQGMPNSSFGIQGLSLLERGVSADQAGGEMINSDTGRNVRQLAIVDSRGNSYAYTGINCRYYSGHILGNGYSIQGNLLSGIEILKAIEQTFLQTSGDLSERLLRSVEAAQKLSNDRKAGQSAALLVVRENGGFNGFDDHFVDIRVDGDSLPVVRLRQLYDLWQETYMFDARLRSIDDMNRKKKFIAADTEKKRLAESFNMQLRRSPADPNLLNKIAWILATKEIDKEQAIELAKRAVRLVPNEVSYLETLAECHYRLNHIDEAIAIESELASKDPANDRHWRQLQKFREAKMKSGN